MKMVGWAWGRVLVVLLIMYNWSSPRESGTFDAHWNGQGVGAQRREVCEL